MHADKLQVPTSNIHALKMVLPSAALGLFLCLASRSRRRRAFRTSGATLAGASCWGWPSPTASAALTLLRATGSIRVRNSSCIAQHVDARHNKLQPGCQHLCSPASIAMMAVCRCRQIVALRCWSMHEPHSTMSMCFDCWFALCAVMKIQVYLFCDSYYALQCCELQASQAA